MQKSAKKIFLIFSVLVLPFLVFAETVINDNYEKIESTNPAVRRNAAIYLGSEATAKALEVLQAHLTDADSSVRRAVISSLSRIVSSNPEFLKNNLYLNNLVAGLTTQFSIDENIGVRISIISALGTIQSKFSRQFLRQTLKNPYPIYRAEALRAIQNYQNTDDYPLIIQALNDEAEGVRITAAEIVALRKIKNANSLLVKNLTDPVMPVRLSMVRALKEVGTLKEVAELEKMLNDSDPTVSQAAREAIDRIKQRTGR